jgi:hypothetical protein
MLPYRCDEFQPPLPVAVVQVLARTTLAYLATCEVQDQQQTSPQQVELVDERPHLSLMKFSFVDDAELGGVFVLTTRRDTKKYRAILARPRVALMVHDFTDAVGDNGAPPASGSGSFSCSIYGNAVEVTDQAVDARLRSAHLARNTDYPQFIQGAGIALLVIRPTLVRLCDISDKVSTWSPLTHGASPPTPLPASPTSAQSASSSLISPKSSSLSSWPSLSASVSATPFPALITALLSKLSLAYLATCEGGEPHTSLMSFSCVDECAAEASGSPPTIVMTTRRDTKKFENICARPFVALLVHNAAEEDATASAAAVHKAAGGSVSVTLYGHCVALDDADERAVRLRAAHLARNTKYPQFIAGPNVAVLAISVFVASMCDVSDTVTSWRSSE